MDEPLPCWDDSLRPTPPSYPGATASDEAAGRHLAAIHDHYRRGLAAVGDVLDRVRTGAAGTDEARAALHQVGLHRAYQQLGGFCGQLCHALRQHHLIEDAVMYPQLRAADGQLHPVLDRLAEEHLVVHDILERLDLALVALSRDHGALEKLTSLFEHLRALLDSHFAYEEDAIGVALGVHRIGV